MNHFTSSNLFQSEELNIIWTSSFNTSIKMTELLSVPLKKPADVDLIRPLNNLIKCSYNNLGPEKITELDEAVNKFSQQRNTAIWKVFDKYESSLEIIYSYYDQLCALETKISETDFQVPFKWKDAFDKGSIFGGRSSLTVSSLSYEKICVLFNIAALQSAVAATQSLDSDEGLKLAAKLFQQSAGIYSHLKSVAPAAINQDPTTDLLPETLNALASIMLAQAQEIFVFKAIKDNMKDLVIAKLCCNCEEMYSETLRLMQKDSIRTVWDKDWIPTIAGKQAGFHALTMFYHSLVSRNNKAVGEEIARLQKSVELFKIAQSRSGKLNFLEAYQARAQKNLTEAKKDNDFIYNEIIPDINVLSGPGKAQLAKNIPLPSTMSQNFKDLLADLVPVALHQAIAACEMRKNEIVNGEIMKLREATQKLNSLLTSYNLPAAIEATEDGSSLPPSLLEKANTCREKGGIESLQKMVNELPELLNRNREILDEAERLLNDEGDSDEQLRNKFKELWTRTPSSKLTQTFRENCETYRKIINNAITADKTVREKFEVNRNGIELLSKTPEQLSEEIPISVTKNNISNSSATQKLRALIENVDKIKAERDVIELELRSATIDLKDKFLAALASGEAINEPALSLAEIGKNISPLQGQVQDSLSCQETLMRDIKDAQEQFVTESGSSDQSKDSFLTQLATAYDVFSELQQNLRDGVKFYNDLTQLLITFQNKVSDYCFARKTEKEELMKDLTQQASKQIQPPTSNVLAHLNPTTPTQELAASSAPPQPTPYPTQMHGMPIPYGATPNVPYPTYVPPPMPQGFNPYATLPYPNAYQGFPQAQPGAYYGTYPGAYASQQQAQQPLQNPNKPFGW
ncbi:programmed cell death 6-interacting protein [Toxorhynchites rutilus septentrionalis]|uniref:programmed cell death 6-interacting protein n=1 Tax=Toxorhynchites rutilus septentrionalis TaxID=329112 RepID=UPI00247AB9FA|nr:programmed cell death 6-interacting protein [Toxorhynchites rutilus septentrionalis]